MAYHAIWIELVWRDDRTVHHREVCRDEKDATIYLNGLTRKTLETFDVCIYRIEEINLDYRARI